MGTDDTATAPPPANVPTTHPTGFWFFFWGEFAERSSYYGMKAILSLYMVERLGVGKGDAGTYYSLFVAGCYLLPLVGGYIADKYLGKYWTIVGFSLPYLAGHLILGIEDKYAVFAALGLLAMGSGVIKPNISTLMGMTYDEQRPGQTKLRSDAFSWFYFAINFGAFLSTVGVPYVRTHYSYQMAFLFPTFLMAVALAIFAAGKRFYADEWAVRPKVPTPAEAAEQWRLKLQTLGRIGPIFLLIVFFWAIFDQTGSTWVFFADTYMTTTLFGWEVSADMIQFYNPLFIMLLLPINLALFNRIAARGTPVRATTRIALGFLLTAASMGIMSYAGFIAGQKRDAVKVTFPEGSLIVPAWESTKFEEFATPKAGEIAAGTGVRIASDTWKYNPDNKKLTLTNGYFLLADGRRVQFRDGHLTDPPAAADLTAAGVLEPLLKTGDALAAVSKEPATVELEGVDWVPPEQRVTVWWQVLAYLILTIAEIQISVTGLELAYVAAPVSMKGFVTACWLFTVYLANFLINAPITRLYPTMEPGVYFAMLGGALVVVFVVFLPIAARFNRATAAVAAVPRNEGETEAK